MPIVQVGQPPNASPAALVTSKLENLQRAEGNVNFAFAPFRSLAIIENPNGSQVKKPMPSPAGANMSEKQTAIESILARLRATDEPHPTPSPTGSDESRSNAVNNVLASLNDQLKKQQYDLTLETNSASARGPNGSTGSDLYTPVSDTFEIVSDHSSQGATPRVEVDEMLRLKEELANAKSIITRQDQELTETRNLKHTIDQAIGPPSETDFGHRDDSESATGPAQRGFNATARPFTARQESWPHHDDARSDFSDSLSGNGYSRGGGIWSNGPQRQPAIGNGISTNLNQQLPVNDARTGYPGEPNWSRPYGNNAFTGQPGGPPSQRVFSGPNAPTYAMDGRYTNEQSQYPSGGGNRRSMSQFSRSNSTLSNRSAYYPSYGNNVSNMTTSGNMAPLGYGSAFGYQPRPIGTPLSPTTLSPTATEFTTTGSTLSGTTLASFNTPWSSLPSCPGQTYVSTLEPLNYRRLLDKSVNCDWKYIVDKIVCNNDQQASIFLQQKLKVGTAEQKFEIVEAIVNQAYPLMINRFGNFLVQRCFEHGTPPQVVAIAEAIHGNVLSLSCDAFGCHVIQKAFDSVPEKHKADMVRELLRRIPDTVIHRYACHVWQKLFELRWSGEPPQIMLKVNEALHGMWHEVALGETGSLVVQNIFENCVEEEKRPAIEEVIANIDLIAHGQFGNWCIQHLCEHGSPPDKRRVVDHILANAYNYSIDQFASKVVEKCLKIGGVDFLERYLGAITTPLPDRPRIPLVDIAGDQYGNYLIQWILMNTHHHQREQVAIHIRKHMVSLRGSKFGSRVAMLCCNPLQTTRPGPGVVVNPFGVPGQPRSTWPRGAYR
ncbi:MAG: hypothetical protein Q9160_005176 [Pyrenula sp. 1 TL-2023]